MKRVTSPKNCCLHRKKLRARGLVSSTRPLARGNASDSTTASSRSTTNRGHRRGGLPPPACRAVAAGPPDATRRKTQCGRGGLRQRLNDTRPTGDGRGRRLRSGILRPASLSMAKTSKGITSVIAHSGKATRAPEKTAFGPLRLKANDSMLYHLLNTSVARRRDSTLCPLGFCGPNTAVIVGEWLGAKESTSQPDYS